MTTITQMKKTNNKAGQGWFDKGTMAFFNTQIETKPDKNNVFYHKRIYG